jgi:hypothetical protein
VSCEAYYTISEKNSVSQHRSETSSVLWRYMLLHDISNIFISVPRHVFSFTRKINNHSISNFTSLLSYENWEDVFLETNVNIIFKNFLNTSLRIFYSSFPVNKSQYSYKPKPLLTTGIRFSCANKRKLYLTYRTIMIPILKNITTNIAELWLGSLYQQ